MFVDAESDGPIKDVVQHPAVGAWLITDKDFSDLNKSFDLSEICFESLNLIYYAFTQLHLQTIIN